jgi:hypothetical protein
VTFYDGTTVLGTVAVVKGQAELTTLFLPPGASSLKAYYTGDSNDGPSTSASLIQNVNVRPGGGFQAPVNYGAG